KLALFASMTTVSAVGLLISAAGPTSLGQTASSCCAGCALCGNVCRCDCPAGCQCCSGGACLCDDCVCPCCTSTASVKTASTKSCCAAKTVATKSGLKSIPWVRTAVADDALAVADATRALNATAGCCSGCELCGETCVCNCAAGCHCC